MNNKIIFILILLTLSFSQVANAEVCSSKGYTILTINGVFTDETGAQINKNALKYFSSYLSLSEPITVDYVYNPTHTGGAGDIIDSIKQGLFSNAPDYDLVEMINDASRKVKTQKLLLVAHSQGNFYSNKFYNKVADKDGGIASKSIGVYGVANPDSYVAGGGKYITSSTDKVISTLLGKVLSQKILPPNTSIDLKDSSDYLGHNFSDVYLKYRGDKIVSDIKESLLKLKNDELKNSSSPCLDPLKITLIHSVVGIALKTSDAVVDTSMSAINTGVKTLVLIEKTYITMVIETSNYLIQKSANLAIAGAKIIGSVSKSIYALGKNTLASAGSILGLTDNKVTLVSGDESLNIPIDVVIPVEENNNQEEVKIDENEIEKTPILNDSPIEENEVIKKTNEEILITEETPIPTNSNHSSSNNETIIQNDDTKVIETPKDETPIPPVGIDKTVYTTSDLDADSIDDSIQDEVIVSTNVTLIAGTYKFNNLIITNNVILTLKSDQNSTEEYKGVKIKAKNITVHPGSSISADGEGYEPLTGPGASSVVNIGASYGGKSLEGLDSSIYGSSITPFDLGSGSKSKGGGAIYLEVKEILTNDGVISSNGKPSSSGGSIYVKTEKLSGSGAFSANGGGIYIDSIYLISPGGGGRVAIHYAESDYTGLCEAKAGVGSYDGWSSSYASPGTAGLFDIKNNNLKITSTWKFEENSSPFNFNEIIFTNKSKIESNKNANIKATSLLVEDGSTFYLASDVQSLEIPNITLDNKSVLTLSKYANINIDNIILKNISSITTKIGEEINLTLKNINIDTTSFINTDAKGLVIGLGTPLDIYSGAGYGGYGGGGITSSKIYGSENEPVDMGSGGHGASPIGGGAIRIIASNTFVNNGIISANGNNTSSGGSIYITTDILEGSGNFITNGGTDYYSSACQGPGGGGRIAIYYKTLLFPKGNAQSNGGSGYCGVGSVGTIKWIDRNIVIPDPIPVPILSSVKLINSFDFENMNPKVIGVINNVDNKIILTVPYGTNITTLSPVILISEKAKISPLNISVQDFTNPITYTITAEDNSTSSYIVSVVVSPNPNPTPPPPVADTQAPSVNKYTFNGNEGSITINPTMNNLSISLKVSEKVDWVSFKIEKEDDQTMYRIYFPDTLICDDGTDTCTIIWNGILSSGGSLQHGIYKINLHIRDVALNEFYDYLSPYKIIVPE